MYEVEMEADKVTVLILGSVAMVLTGGNALLIGATYKSMESRNKQGAQDFIHGVLAGLNHVTMTGRLPSVR